MKPITLLLVPAVLMFFSCNQNRTVDSTPAGFPAGTPAASVPEQKPVEVAAAAEPEAVFDEDNKRDVTVFYRHTQFDGLIPLKRTIITNSLTSQVLQVIDLLSINPTEKDGAAVWPTSTYVREVYPLIGNREGVPGTLVIDFGKQFVGGLSAGVQRETYLIYSLVNSVLLNFEEFDRVHILVDGETRETLLGHVDIEGPLRFNRRIYTVIPDFREDEEIIIEDLPPEENGQRELAP